MKFDKNHPMIRFLVDRDGKPETMTWAHVAKMFGVNSTERITASEKAQAKWNRFRKTNTYKSLVLKKRTIDRDGNVINEVFGRDSYTPEVDMDNMTVIGGTTDSNGGPGWWRMISNDQLADLERMQTDIEAAHAQKSLSFSNKSQKFQKWVIIGCVHVPYHNTKLWNGFLKYLSENKVDGIVIAGDFLDLKSISSHDKDKMFTKTLYEEYAAGYERILEIESLIGPDTKRIFMYGNHEDRYIREITKITGARYGAALQSPESGMKLKELGWTVFTNWKDDFITVGSDLEVIHGYRLGNGAMKNSLVDSMKNNKSVAFFHTHAYGSHTNGKYAAYNGGGFFDRNNREAFGYVGRNTREGWQNGFLQVVIDSENDTHVTPVKCTDTGFFANNKHY